MIGVLALLGVLLVATAGGLWWQRRNGVVREVAVSPDSGSPDSAALAWLGVAPDEAPVTVVQFSSAFCAPCRATRRVLDEVTAMLPAVRHVEVDAESHLDAVRALNILRTPTVLIVDRAGQVVKRASGLPRKADIVAAVAPYLT